MHPALRINEILLNIFGHYDSATDLTSLARTCRAFNDPALDILWEDVSDLYSLVKCLPGLFHRLCSDRYRLKSSLSRTEWDTIQSYTRRIRFIENFRPVGIDKESLATLSNPPTTGPLFPNLRSLGWLAAAEAKYLMRFPLPSLVSIKITAYNQGSLKKSLIKFFPTLSRNIRSIMLESRENYGSKVGLDYLVFSYIRRWPNLQTVHIPPITINMDTLRHLSRLPALTLLDCQLSKTLLLPEPSITFSTLCSLTLRCESCDLLSRLISTTRLVALIEFCAFVRTSPSRRELLSLWSSLRTSNADHTIEDLWLSEWSTPESGGSPPEAPLLGFEDLRPCMVFGNLRILNIDIPWHVDLTDGELLSLASAYPRLESLSINPSFGWNTQGGITPTGLLQLLQICQSLNDVKLVMDTRGYTEFSVPPEGVGSALRRLHSLNVLDSFIEPESVPGIIAFLIAIASGPCLWFYCWDCRHRDPPGWETHRDRWEDARIRVKAAVRQGS